MKNLENYLGCLPDYVLISVNGPDASRFLQGQLTADIHKLSPNHALLTACCDHKGRMIANFWIWPEEEGFQLILPKSMNELLQNHLKKYAVFSKVQIQEAETPFTIAFLTANKMSPKKIPKNNEIKYLQLTRLKSAYFIIASPNAMKAFQEQLLSLANTEKISLIDDRFWTQFLIEKGIAILSPKTSERFTPQMINLQLQGGVSFQKGCYIGQEVVARTEHLGKLKRHLYQFKINSSSIPKPGDGLYQNGQLMGTIVNASSNDNNYVVGLGVIEDRGIKDDLYLEENHLKIKEVLRMN